MNQLFCLQFNKKDHYPREKIYVDSGFGKCATISIYENYLKVYPKRITNRFNSSESV
jgi:hypothetical protein